MSDKRGIFVSESHFYLRNSVITGSIRATGAAMATSGEFRFLTLGVLLVVVGLTRAEIATSEEFTLEEIESWPWFQDTAFVQQPGYVYLIREENLADDEPTNFKIGRSSDPQTRLSNLQTGNPRKLLLVKRWRVPNPVACEGILKVRLSGYKSPLGGGTEWFTVRSDQATFIRLFTRYVNQYC